MNDLQAVERIKRGDPSGLAVLVKRYQGQAVRAAATVTQDRRTAEDVVQTVFVGLFRTVHTFDLRRPFAPWFFRCVVNAAVKAAKQQRQTVSLDAIVNPDTGDTFAELLPGIAALPTEHVEHEELRTLIHDALGKLTPEQRAVVVMRYYLDLEIHEISTELARPAATIRWRLHSALKRLRGLLLTADEGQV